MRPPAYAQRIWPWSARVGLALHMGWHIVDGADGDLARLTGRSSPTGELVVGPSDYRSPDAAVRQYRRIALSRSMIAGSPAYYLLFEAVLLNLVLAGSIRKSNAAIDRVVADLGQPVASSLR